MHGKTLYRHLKPDCVAIVVVCVWVSVAVSSLMMEGYSGIISWPGSTVRSVAWSTNQSLLHLGHGAGTTGEVSVSANRSKMGSRSSEVVLVVRRVGGSTSKSMSRNNALLVRRLPVNGSHTLVELGRMAELPLAEDRPKNGYTANRSCDYDEHSGDRGLFRGGGGQILRGMGGRCGRISGN